MRGWRESVRKFGVLIRNLQKENKKQISENEISKKKKKN